MYNRLNRRRKRAGFTLMEVLLVMAILVILGSLVTVSFVRIQQNANRDGAKNQIKALSTAIDAYTLNIGTAPTTQQGFEALKNAPADLKNPAKWAGPYLEKEIPLDPWSNPYNYEQLTANTYRIWSSGPDGNSGSDDDVMLDP
ncbi:general secretion pathway protein G [Pirellula staleyi DSM 6068]|uniref:Type II secretion system core protein G n=1 Tax=Pirellula staleyi (strain ATCC 27377 / DSM 6068 / ICPB 4128) TaxID=530564 RepID=D2QZD7_PIRSD|nr:type II secretion system major pseudopilin GspG [Pirellula staleyi]ADB18329.1 general secretion pathway protein G [Pirellula staleyi DSM 6068]